MPDPESESREPMLLAPEQVIEPGLVQPPNRRWPGVLALLSLLLSLAALGMAGWQWWSASVADRAVDSTADEIAPLRASLREAQRRLSQFEPLAQRQQEFANALAALRDQGESRGAALEGLERRLLAFEARLEAVASTDRSDWLLAQVEYLLRLANDQLVIAGNHRVALRLLQSADRILQGFDDVRLHALRAQLAEEITTLRATDVPDIEGRFLTLSAWGRQADLLPLVRSLPDRFATTQGPTTAAPSEAPLWSRLWSRVVAELRTVFVVRRIDEPLVTPLTPERAFLLRGQLRLLLEQAQLALLAGEQDLFVQVIKETEAWLGTHFDPQDAGVVALQADLQAMAAAPVRADWPSISGSLETIQKIIKTRHFAEDE